MDINRLFVQLNNTGLSQKDNPLYQLLFNLLQAIQSLNSGSATTNNSITNITNIINNLIQQLLSGTFSDSDNNQNIYQLIIGSNGSSTDTYAAPLTNGDGLLPELVFDSNGDVIMVTGLTTP